MPTIRLSCKFCGAKEDRDVATSDIREIGATWIQAHKPCAAGKAIRVDITGQQDEQGQADQLGSFRIDPDKAPA